MITGNAGNNALSGGSGDDILAGGLGSDKLYGGTGNDTISGGDVTFDRNGALIKLDPKAGIDTMAGGYGDDTYLVNSNAGVVIEQVNQGFDTVYASDSYRLSNAIEKLVLTGTGNINATGNESGSILFGNAGNNHLTGGGGDDELRGFDGNDTLYGGNGGDILYGGAGNDLLDGGAGADDMAGDVGDDAYVVNNAADLVSEAAGGGKDTVQSSVTYTLAANVENLTLTGNAAIDGTGNASHNTLVGNGFSNVLSGLAGDDVLFGGNGNDVLLSGIGKDVLYGGLGNDTLNGDLGEDILSGGAGVDVFVFDTLGAGDRITDFTTGIDHIQIVSTLVDLMGGQSAVRAGSFYSASGAVNGHDADDRLIYNTKTGALYFDVDGNGTTAAVQIATLDSVSGAVPRVTYADFTFG